jgi:hypothetical protein
MHALLVYGVGTAHSYAWPPHQIMAWVGLERYGHLDDAQRLAYRWLYMMTTAFVDFNGVVPEKVSFRLHYCFTTFTCCEVVLLPRFLILVLCVRSMANGLYFGSLML